MYRILITLLFLFTVPFYATAQITPADNSTLNYRLVGCSFPKVANASGYIVEVASGNMDSEDSFIKHIIDTKDSKTNRIIIEVPSFNAPYTWRVITTDSHNGKTKGELHHFSTGISRLVDTSVSRLHILTPDASNEERYVFIDATKTLYDMAGNPVWFMPEKKNMHSNGFRDIKASVWGTITLMVNQRVYEMNYNGDILWEEPGDKKPGEKKIPGTRSNFNHEFTHLQNGDYMSLGMEHVMADLSTPSITTPPLDKKDSIAEAAQGNQIMSTGKIIEFNKDHKVVWSWRSADYFKKSDLYHNQMPPGLASIGTAHENAFYMDEKAKTLYVSYRNLDRIVKVKYPEGKVLNTYGKIYQPGDMELTNGLFCGQHCIMRSQEGYIYMYNNNTCNRLCGRLPTIVMLQEPTSAGGKLKKVWEYECTLDEVSAGDQAELRFETGGSVFELPDGAIFCCMAGNYDKVFIVSRDKKVLWSAVTERFSVSEKKWHAGSGYRASIIDRKQLESLIWNEPLKK